MKVRLWNKLESFLRCEEQLWPDCGGPSNTFLPPHAPSEAAKPPKPVPFRVQAETQVNCFKPLYSVTVVNLVRGAEGVPRGGTGGPKASTSAARGPGPPGRGPSPKILGRYFINTGPRRTGSGTGPHVIATDPRAVRGGRTACAMEVQRLARRPPTVSLELRVKV